MPVQSPGLALGSNPLNAQAAQGQVLETNWRVEYGKKHSQQCYSLANSGLKLDPFSKGQQATEMSSYTPILRSFVPWDIKSVLCSKPRMVALLTTDGKLRIYNAKNIDDVLQQADTFQQVMDA